MNAAAESEKKKKHTRTYILVQARVYQVNMCVVRKRRRTCGSSKGEKGRGRF